MTSRTLFIALMLTGTLASGSFAQTSGQNPDSRKYFPRLSADNIAKLETAKRNYLFCLKSLNDGVVESGLAHCSRIKLSVPWADLTDLKEVIDGLAVSGRTPAIRYRAYLVTLVFDSPGLFAEEARQDYATSEELFTALSSRLQQTLLGYSDRKYVRPQ